MFQFLLYRNYFAVKWVMVTTVGSWWKFMQMFLPNSLVVNELQQFLRVSRRYRGANLCLQVHLLHVSTLSHSHHFLPKHSCFLDFNQFFPPSIKRMCLLHTPLFLWSSLHSDLLSLFKCFYSAATGGLASSPLLCLPQQSHPNLTFWSLHLHTIYPFIMLVLGVSLYFFLLWKNTASAGCELHLC